jgi:hypothetical protein
MDHITSWHEYIRLYKYDKALVQHHLFTNLDGLVSEVKSFFDPEDFKLSGRLNPDNWFLHILANHVPNSICIVNETAELIRYLRSLNDISSYKLRKNGKLNYKALQEWFYEIYVHYIFSRIGLDPRTGYFYTGTNGQKKEIDILIQVDEQCYNIEVTKFYDAFKEELLGLTTDSIFYINQIAYKRKLHLHEMFSGYYLFKTRDEKIIRQNKPMFAERIKNVLHGYRGQPDDVIRYPAKISTDEFEADLEPTFSDNFVKTYPKILAGYPGSFRFRLTANQQSNRFHIEAHTECLEEKEGANRRLLAKIDEKLHQHKLSPHPLLIIIGIEQMFSSHLKSRALPIQKRHVDTQAIHHLIRGKAIVCLIFKEMLPLGVHYDKLILGNSIAHSNLIHYLQQLDPLVTYKKSSTS